MKKRLSRILEPGVVFFFVVLLIFVGIAAVRQDYLLAGVELAVTALVFILYRVAENRRHKELANYIQRASAVEANVDSIDCPLPMTLIRPGDGNILWTNDAFDKISGHQEKMRRQSITDYLPGFSLEWLTSGKTEYAYDVTMRGRRFRINGTIFRAGDSKRSMLAMLYFADLTELYQVRDEYIRSRPVVSLILIDNYEELTKNMNESAMSALNVQIGEIIVKWTEDYHGLLRRLERNRYLFVFEHRYLQNAIDGKFSLLENIHRVKNSSGVQASISCGFGVDCESFDEGFRYAALSIEMALSRGGNQAVVKNRYEFSFYGGVERETEHGSKVRSRVMSNTLMELIGQSEHVFIMGHRNTDLDALGAAMGIVCMCRKSGKNANIILDPQKNAAGQLLRQIEGVPEYHGVFMSTQDALLHCNSRSLLVVVDTNRPEQVESRPLLEAISRVCVIDHHRRAADYIEEPVLECHDTSASSASELVTEFLQYTVETSDVLPIEAKGLLAGIFLDTKSFQMRTRDRTFEAAALLQRMGADTIEVKKLLQNNFKDTMEKYDIIKAARQYREKIAIAALDTTTTRVLAAQAADELLNISGISASFVLYPQGEEVIISGRSIGDVNVQLILEPLGGGGNAATAGAQVPGKSVKEVRDELIRKIDQFYDDREAARKQRNSGKE